MNEWGMLIDDLASRNAGLILTRDLKLAGLGDGAIRQITRSWYRICRGAYVLERPADRWAEHLLHVRAVVLRHERPVVVSHISAALFHDLPLWRVDLGTAHITGIDRMRRGRRSRVHTHDGPLPEDETIEMDGLDVTNVARTVMDCARMLPFDQAVAIADQALHSQRATLADLRLRCARLHPVTGVDEARRLVEVADGRAESPGESRTRLICLQARIPVEPQVEIHRQDGTFIGRVDLLVNEADVILEFDGRGKYTLSGDPERAHWDEKRRHDALQEAGYVVVRIVWEDLSSPAEVVARIRRAIARARSAR